MKSIDLAYWIGVVQTDGYFKKTFVKSIQVTRYYIWLNVGICSIEMLKKFRISSQKVFGIKGNTWFDKKRNNWQFKFGCKNLLSLFKEFSIDFSDPPKPPKWVVNNSEYFGAYLAGVIDGDGDVRIKRPNYPQCAVRVSSGTPAKELTQAISSSLKIGVSQSFSQGSSKIGMLGLCSGLLQDKHCPDEVEVHFVKYITK